MFAGSGTGLLFDLDSFTFATGTPPSGVGPVEGWRASAWTCRSGPATDGTQIQLYACTGGAAQTVDASGQTLRAYGKCLDVNGGGTADGTKVQLWTCNGGHEPELDGAVGRHVAQPAVRQVPGRVRQQLRRRHGRAPVDVHRERGQPEVDPP